MTIATTFEGDVAVVRIDRPRGNAIDDGFLDAVSAALEELASGPCGALVITGGGRAFSGGLDLLAIHDFDRERAGRFVDAFEAFFLRVLTFPRPVVAAVNGHAIAGGAILAMAADYRVIAPGSQLSINEVLVGLAFPSCAHEIAYRAIPAAWRAEAFLGGKRYTAEEAVARGIVHELADERGVVAHAVARATALTAGGRDVVADTKGDLLAPVLERIEKGRASKRERFLDRWSSPDTRGRIGKVRDELLAKRAARGVAG